MEIITTDTLWRILLEMRALLRTIDSFNETLLIEIREPEFRIIRDAGSDCISLDGSTIIISKNEPASVISNTIFYSLNEQYMPVNEYNHLLGKDQFDFFNRYLQYCFSSLHAKSLGRCVTILHFAQTLDGKIATNTGNSKWIGNTDNLHHAHRMRALSDGVLIGANTLRCDKPALTVRYVEGPNPAKIVVGNSVNEFESLIQNDGKVIFLTSHVNGCIRGVENVIIASDNGHIEPNNILKELFKLGITSLYIEGGAVTASSFLTGKCIDSLQLFLAPRIFGSGIPNFSLPEISEINEAVSFSDALFQPMGNGILFSGKVNY
jgi:diaminohydroxyphosphoribosylaminopyrimidine deaminase/5-amino-6-(5-phosphoribosylamino)uracil reductase